MGRDWDLEQATEFLVVAATLLDLKAARLLPSGEVEDEEDLALLEARDLLFARLLQYRAYKEVAAVFADRMADEAGGSRGRSALEARSPAAARGAARPRARRVRRAGRTGHDPAADPGGVARPPPRAAGQRPRAGRAAGRPAAPGPRRRPSGADRRLHRTRSPSWPGSSALLELYRDGAVAFDQVDPLGELHVRWTGPTTATSRCPTSSTSPTSRRRRVDESPPATEASPTRTRSHERRPRRADERPAEQRDAVRRAD